LRKIMLLAAIVPVVLAAAAPALAGSQSPNNSGKNTLGKATSGKNKDLAGLVDVGGGRKMYLECQGKGSPTIVFVSGAGDRTETWSETLYDNDTLHSSRDGVAQHGARRTRVRHLLRR
jgi:hypothetical protein